MNDKSNSDEIREGATPVTRTAPPSILIGPEYAFAEEDVREVVAGEVIVGTSLWRDAWRRLMKNKRAVLGMIIVIAIVIAAVFGPSVIKAATGYSYDFIPKDPLLTKSFAPFRAPDGRLSWTHPMGTDNAGRDILARVLAGGQISLMVALISTLVPRVIPVSYWS